MCLEGKGAGKASSASAVATQQSPAAQSQHACLAAEARWRVAVEAPFARAIRAGEGDEVGGSGRAYLVVRRVSSTKYRVGGGARRVSSVESGLFGAELLAELGWRTADAAGAICHLTMNEEPMAKTKRKLAAMIGLCSRDVAMACRE